MEPITYSQLKKEDLPAIGEIINQAFGLYRYVSDEKLLDIFKKQYVYSCLSEATYVCVARRGDEPVGVIMGNAKSDYKLFRHIPFLLNTVWYSLKFKLLAKNSEGIKDFLRLHSIYDKFSKKHKGEFDGVLTLFAVNKDCRGEGVGKKLLGELKDYLKEHGTKNIYLYTDTTCNFGFYEHEGFNRLEEEHLLLTRDGKPLDMQVYLYGYHLK